MLTNPQTTTGAPANALSASAMTIPQQFVSSGVLPGQVGQQVQLVNLPASNTEDAQKQTNGQQATQDGQQAMMMMMPSIANLNGIMANNAANLLAAGGGAPAPVSNGAALTAPTTTAPAPTTSTNDKSQGDSTGDGDNAKEQLGPALISAASLSSNSLSNSQQVGKGADNKAVTNPSLGAGNQQFLLLQQNGLAAPPGAIGGGQQQQVQQQGQQQQQQMLPTSALLPLGANNLGLPQDNQLQLLQQQLQLQQQQQLARALYGQQLMNPAATPFGFPTPVGPPAAGAGVGLFDPISQMAAGGAGGRVGLAAAQLGPQGPGGLSLPLPGPGGLDPLGAKAAIDPSKLEHAPQKLIFPEMLHKMLTEVEMIGKAYIISFVGNGKAFKIHKPHDFTSEILPLYYPKQSRLTSFKKQLHLYGFELIGIGIYNGCYFHPLFIKDRADLCKSIRRKDLKQSAAKKKHAAEIAAAIGGVALPEDIKGAEELTSSTPKKSIKVEEGEENEE